MKRPGYREAVDWLAGNDDCYWLGEGAALKDKALGLLMPRIADKVPVPA